MVALNTSKCLQPMLCKGPSIYDVHMEGAQVQVDGGGSIPMWTSTQNIKIRVHDVILSSSPAKKLAYFFTRISSLGGIKSGNVSAI